MYLVFDIGGTKTRVAISEDNQTFASSEIIPTLTNFNEAMIAFEKIVQKLSSGKQIKAAAGGVRALGLDKRKLANRKRLDLWVGEPLYERVQDIVKAPLFLENDADMAGLGEAVFGAGKGYTIVVYMTISTGVGGTRVVDGKTDINSLGFEPGYQIIHNDKNLGDYISGRALEDLYGQKAENIKDPKIWEEVAKYLAIGLNNLIVLWSPDIIVLGGSVTQSIPLDIVAKDLKELLTIFPLPKIVKSDLGNESGMFGALALLNQSGL